MIRPWCTSTEPIGMPPSRAPRSASSMAACMNSSGIHSGVRIQDSGFRRKSVTLPPSFFLLPPSRSAPPRRRGRAMLVRLGHAETTNGVPLEIELDQHDRLVPNDPPVVTRLDGDHLRSRVLRTATIVILDADSAAGEKPDVRVHAQLRADQRFHVRRPSESGRVHHALDSSVRSTLDVELDSADFAVVGVLQGGEERVSRAHVTLLHSYVSSENGRAWVQPRAPDIRNAYDSYAPRGILDGVDE